VNVPSWVILLIAAGINLLVVFAVKPSMWWANAVVVPALLWFAWRDWKRGV
jgi:hypothetical protein